MNVFQAGADRVPSGVPDGGHPLDPIGRQKAVIQGDIRECADRLVAVIHQLDGAVFHQEMIDRHFEFAPRFFHGFWLLLRHRLLDRRQLPFPIRGLNPMDLRAFHGQFGDLEPAAEQREESGTARGRNPLRESSPPSVGTVTPWIHRSPDGVRLVLVIFSGRRKALLNASWMWDWAPGD